MTIPLNDLPIRVGDRPVQRAHRRAACSLPVQVGAQDILLNTPKLPGESRWEYDDLAGAARPRRIARPAPDRAGECADPASTLRSCSAKRGVKRSWTTCRQRCGTWAEPEYRSWATTGCRTEYGAQLRDPPCAAAPSPTRSTTQGQEMLRSPTAASLAPTRCGPTTTGTLSACCRCAKRPACAWRCTRTIRPCQCLAASRASSQVRGLSARHGDPRQPHARAGLLQRLLVRDARRRRRAGGDRVFRPPGSRTLYMHLRDVQGCDDNFTECFVDEGQSDVSAVARKLIEVGFNGFILDDHVPHLVNDSPYGHRGRAWSTGYIKALIDSVNAEA